MGARKERALARYRGHGDETAQHLDEDQVECLLLDKMLGDGGPVLVKLSGAVR